MKYRLLLWHLTGWLLLIAYSLAGLWATGHQPAVIFIAMQTVGLVSLAGVFYYCLLLVYPFVLQKSRRLLLIPALLLAPALYAALGYLFMRLMYQVLPAAPPFTFSMTDGYVFGYIYWSLPAIILSAVLWVVQQRFWQLKQETALKMAAAETASNYLQLQNSAAFLKSALQAVAPLAYAVSDQLAGINQRLLYHLQYIQSQPASGRVHITDDVTALQNYIAIQKLCLPEPSYIEIKAEGDTQQQLIAPLILLPLAENALHNGVMNDSLRPVRIAVKLTGSQLTFTASCKLKQQPDDSLLEAVRIRLNQAYAGRHELLVSANGQTHKVTLYLTLLQQY